MTRYKNTLEHSELDFPASRSRWPKASYLIDWGVTLFFGVLTIVLFVLPPPTLYFRINDPDLNFPLIDPKFPVWITGAIDAAVPTVVLVAMQFYVRSFTDFHHAALGTTQSVVISEFIAAFLWYTVGGLRPNFIARCKPDPVIHYIPDKYYPDTVCTCPTFELTYAKHSFPSGHAATVFSVLSFLSLYLNAKLKIWDANGHFWKLASFFIPFSLASWVSFSRVVDGSHFEGQVWFGAALGVASSFLTYKLNYCSVFGPDNHIPKRFLWTSSSEEETIPISSAHGSYQQGDIGVESAVEKPPPPAAAADLVVAQQHHRLIYGSSPSTTYRPSSLYHQPTSFTS